MDTVSKWDEGYKAMNDKWSVCRALEFTLNFCKNHKGCVSDEDLFAAFDKVVEQDVLCKALEAQFRADGVLHEGEDGELFVFDNDGDEEAMARRVRRLDSPCEMLRYYWNLRDANRSVRRVVEEIARGYLATETANDAKEDPLCGRLDAAQRLLGLSDFERELLTLCALKSCDLIDWNCGRRSGRSDRTDEMVAKCMDCNQYRVTAAVKEKSKLNLYECLDNDFDVMNAFDDYLKGATSEPLTDRYYSAVKEAPLPWDFFSDIVKKHGKTLTDIIRASAGKCPCNILLYGKPGTGKTSFARALAAQLGLKAYQVSIACSTDSRTGNPVRARAAAVRVCASQVPRNEGMIIVDEADALFWQDRSLMFSARMDKGEMNELLELKSAPTIWISNNSRGELDDSNCRRFDYSIHFDALTDRQRVKIWRNALGNAGIPNMFSSSALAAIARKYPVSAGGVAIAVKNLAEQNPVGRAARSLVDRILKPHCELLGLDIGPKKKDEVIKPSKDYSLDGLNITGDIKLDQIVESVKRYYQEKGKRGADVPRMNILLSGAPGTGKTEFVKYLGAELKKKVHTAMGSELLSCWVGGTEKNVREAFAMAAKRKEILFLDEIDGLVQSRAGASHGWEVSQVNEILHQMENFKGVMVGATNFADNLDPAIMRRFTFKLQFDYLDNDGKAKFFTRFFKLPLSEAERRELDGITNLAPGDFRTVRQSRHYLGGTMTAAGWLEALRAESAAKRLPGTTRIGF